MLKSNTNFIVKPVFVSDKGTYTKNRFEVLSEEHAGQTEHKVTKFVRGDVFASPEKTELGTFLLKNNYLAPEL